MSNQIPLRSTQASPLSSDQHDTIHLNLRTDVDSLIAIVNSLVVASGIPTGVILTTVSTTLDTGFLWANGQAVSRTTYANLFARCGVTWGSGNGSTTFNLPKMMGRVVVYSNPLGGVTDGTLSTRTLGSYFGTESFTDSRTYAITAQPVTGNTPSLNVSATGSMTNPHITVTNTMAVSAVTGGVLSGSVANTLAVSAVTGGVLSGNVLSTLAVSPVTGGVLSGSVANNLAVSALVNGTIATSCTNVNGETGSTSVIACNPLVSNVSGGVLSGIVTNGTLAVTPAGGGVLSGAVTNGSLAVSPAAGGVLSGTVTNGSLAVTPAGGGVLSGGVTAAIDNPAITVSGVIAPVAITGATVTGITDSNPATISIMQSALVLNAIIRI